jgi:hypothetical protein
VVAVEHGVDRHKRQVAAELRRPVDGGLSEADDRNLHRGARLVQARVLKVAERERVIALRRGFERVIDRERRTAELRQAPKAAVGR